MSQPLADRPAQSRFQPRQDPLITASILVLGKIERQPTLVGNVVAIEKIGPEAERPLTAERQPDGEDLIFFPIFVIIRRFPRLSS